ncbi:MAG: hypothetical protein QOD06_487 [Candidatus Binatota bacterium]|nr:hypothetical protein [Candidatus Binatota bacterium]
MRALTPTRRSRVGTGSLLVAVAGSVACQAALAIGVGEAAPWLRLVAHGFEAAVVGALADWFAVTALFRHPLGLPIPHTAIIPARRRKITESIVSMIEDEWLSPEVIGTRLQRLTPSALVVDWLGEPTHVTRLGAPLRDLLRALARMLGEPDVAEFLDHTIHRQLAEVPIDRSTGEWLARAVANPSAGGVFESLALSLGNLADRPRTAVELQWWLERSARKLRQSGKRVVPFFLRRKIVQEKIVEAACAYASAELRSAAADPEHPLRRAVFSAVGRFGERLARGEPEALAQIERLRAAVVESLESGPIVREALGRLREQIEHELEDPASRLSELVDRKLHTSIVEFLGDPERRDAFDEWVIARARELLERHHHEIGRTVRENLDALDTSALVQQIEDRVGSDLQFIRLNGAVVGGLIGLLIAGLHLLLGG